MVLGEPLPIFVRTLSMVGRIPERSRESAAWETSLCETARVRGPKVTESDLFRGSEAGAQRDGKEFFGAAKTGAGFDVGGN
jgi:hypothetical protein